MSEQGDRLAWANPGAIVMGLLFLILGLTVHWVFLWCAACFLLWLVVAYFNVRSHAQAWPPETTGRPVLLRAITSADAPISESAAWHGDELEVRSDQATTIKLFDVDLDRVEHCRISYRFEIQTENLRSAVYAEMWCRIPDKGEFFSRDLNKKITGTNDWVQVETPFYLQKGQVADLLHLNLVFEGEGTARLRGIEVTSTPAA